MVTVVENPVETSFVEAIYKYNGKFIGMEVIAEGDDGSAQRVIVKLVSDTVPDKKFVGLMDELGVTYCKWAIYDQLSYVLRKEFEQSFNK